MTNGRRVVITGMGAVTPIGLNVKDFWENTLAGKSGASRIQSFDTETYQTQVAAEIRDFNPSDHFDKKEQRKIDRFVQFAIVTAKEAFSDSGLDLNREDPNKIGVYVGSGIGGLCARLGGRDRGVGSQRWL